MQNDIGDFTLREHHKNIAINKGQKSNSMHPPQYFLIQWLHQALNYYKCNILAVIEKRPRYWWNGSYLTFEHHCYLDCEVKSSSLSIYSFLSLFFLPTLHDSPSASFFPQKTMQILGSEAFYTRISHNPKTSKQHQPSISHRRNSFMRTRPLFLFSYFCLHWVCSLLQKKNGIFLWQEQ